MPDPIDPVSTGEETTTDPAAQPVGGAPETPTVDTADANALAFRLRKSEKERDQVKQRLAAFEAEAAKKAESDMSEADKQKARADQAEAKLQETLAAAAEKDKRTAFRLAAKDAGVIDVVAAEKLADLSTLDFDGDEVVGVDAAIKGLKKSCPYLFGSPPPAATGSGGGNPPGGAPQGRTLSAKQLADMPPAEYAKVRPMIASGEIKLIP